MRKIPLVVLILLACNQIATAQVITGVITDNRTGEPLPSATVLYEGTYQGTIANLDGEFTIEADSFPVTLLIRYIGYDSRRVVLEDTPGNRLHIKMDRSVTELEEIVVTDEDPGLSIMEKVIERKKICRSDLETYTVDAFTRQVLRSDTSIVSITESGTRSYWDQNLGHREVQLYRNQTANIAEDQNFAGVRFLPNFYDDNITVAGFDVVGITNPDALRFYDFRLEETQQIDGEPVYVIEVIPKRRLQPLFRGTAYVLGSDYALLEVNLKPNEVVRFPPPVREFDLDYRQQFSNYGGSYWLPVDMRIRGTVRIEMTGLRFPPIQFSQTSRLSEYKINVELPDSLYQSDNELNRVNGDSVSADSARFVPLTEEEVAAYEAIDSTNTLEKAFEPEGFLSGMIGDENDRRAGRNSRFSLPPGFGLDGAFNRVEGFRVGLRYNQSVQKIGFESDISGSYSFHTGRYNAGLTFRQRVPGNFGEKRLYLEASYNNSIEEQSAGSLYKPFMNSIQTVLGGVDYFDYYEQETWRGGITAENILPRVTLAIDFLHEESSSLAKHTSEVMDYSLFAWHKTRRGNPSVAEDLIRSVGVRLDVNREGYNYGISGNRQLRLGAEFASGIFGSESEFSRYFLEADWTLNTFFGRRVFSNTLDLRLTAGLLSGDDVPQRYGVVDGSMSRFTPFGVLKTRLNRPYRGKRYGSLSAEHNFRTVPFELLGLNTLVKRGWGIIFFGGAGYAEGGSDTGFNAGIESDGFHSEAGISLNSVFGLMRIDIAKRLDRKGSYVGVSLPRYF